MPSLDLDYHSRLNGLIYQFAQKYLRKRGWFESLDGVPRNLDGPVPWITYPAFRQLERIVRPDWKVFEFGCGGSSVWWAGKAGQVFAVEHNATWARNVANIAPPNLKVIVRDIGEECSPARKAAVQPFFDAPPEMPLSPYREHNIEHGLICDEFVAYATEIVEHEPESFDVVVVDGMARALTAWLAARYVKPSGIIVFDNADRRHYNGAYRLLHDAGFRRIDFYGPGPVNRWEWCTALFVKDLTVFADNIESPPGDSDLSW
ncbi:hypothetical protein [Phenylobacterium sp.]|uniref:hypothetical protein n=1 Tax=Phenylobacterium sp. TaxID=1871053 RepID=UPI002DEDFBEA|nr:hypothetical protein [Phenylobacterium sp.]